MKTETMKEMKNTGTSLVQQSTLLQNGTATVRYRVLRVLETLRGAEGRADGAPDTDTSMPVGHTLTVAQGNMNDTYELLSELEALVGVRDVEPAPPVALTQGPMKKMKVRLG